MTGIHVGVIVTAELHVGAKIAIAELHVGGKIAIAWISWEVK